MKKESPLRSAKFFSFALLVAVLSAAGCNKGNSTPAGLRISMIPSTDPGKMVRENQPLVEYLRRESGVTVQLTVPTNYAAVVEAISNDQVDIAYFGGFTYVQASKRAGVIPLVQRERDQNFHSFFITRADSAIHDLADLKGRTFAFGDVNSTSGHLMPEYYMRQAGVDLEVISKAIYTGGHDVTALAVANKKVDAGAMDEAVYQRMVSDGKLDSGNVRVFYATPPFFDYVWAARRGLDPRLAEAFTNALLKLDSNNPDHKQVLEFLGATKYLRARDSDYDLLRQAAIDAGMLK